MIDINWHQLEKNSESKEISFEKFCFQIAYKKYYEYGDFEVCYNAEGSEFYLELKKDCEELNLKAGDIIGWQAKFWRNRKDEDNSPLDIGHQNELIEGFTKTIIDKVNLKYWIICTPGKFSNNKPQNSWNKLKEKINNIKADVSINQWHKVIFESFYHSNPENYNSIFNHYFNTKFICKELLNSFTINNLKLLERKFDVDIHIKDKSEIGIMSSIFLNEGDSEIKRIISLLGNLIKDIKIENRYEIDEFENLPNDLISLVNGFFNKHILVIEKIEVIIQQSKDIINRIKQIKQIIDSFIDDTETDRIELNKQVNEIHNIFNSNIFKFREREWVSFNIQSVNDISELLVGLENDTSLLKSCIRLLSNDVHIFSAAGFGKTNYACSVAYEMIKSEKPVLLLLGSTFRNSNFPKDTILQQLEVSNEFIFKDLLDSINNLGIIYECKIPIIIDGLNESTPTAGDVWNSELNFIINDINKFSNILLITTCREKSEYIQQIFNKESYKDIENNIYLKGFTGENILTAIEKYFTKYDIIPSQKKYDKNLFKNPLRLKIFSDVNKGNHNLDINLHCIVQSIDNYIDSLVKNISTKKRSVDKSIYYKLKSGLNELGELLWSKNSREILFFTEFSKLFNEELVFKLIDEGLCFQRDLNKKEELVQFTYDLVGGYQIANSIFSKNESKELVIKYLQSEETKQKLFSNDFALRHPLHEDILKSISFLLQKNYEIQIFEVYDDESILLESLENLELLAFNEKEKEKLILFIDGLILKTESVGKLLQQLYDDIIQRNNFYTIDVGINEFLLLNQFEIDIYWNELIRKDYFKLISLIKNIQKNIEQYNDSIYNILLFISLLTGSSDKKLRNIATKELMILGLKYPYKLLAIVKRLKNVNDSFILESIICSISGDVLRLKNREFTEEVVSFFENDFLINNPTNHIAILDYIKTIFDFALLRFEIKCNLYSLNRNINEKWYYNDIEFQKIKNSSLYHYEMMDYDFIKYQVTSLSNEFYRSLSKYSKTEIIALILERIKLKGYDNKQYKEIEIKLKEDTKYRREETSEQVIKYAEKYLYIAFMELAGFLMLNKQIEPEFNNSFRYNRIIFDPTFPEIKLKTQLLNDCFLPSYNENIQDWILKDSSNLLQNIYITTPIFENSEMVLLYASIKQENKENNTYTIIDVNSFLFSEKDKVDILEMFETNFYDSDKEFHHIFAGEIPWRLNVFNNNLEIKDKLELTLNEILPLNCQFSWSHEQYNNPYFVFLHPILSKYLNADFDIESLSYIDNKGKFVTKLYKTDNSEFLFINKDIFDKFIKENEYDLIWVKFIAKYGEFGIYNDKKLNPSYKDFRKFDFYSSF